MLSHSLYTFLHLTSVVVWVGGMFFAYVCLRPAAVEVLEPPLRLTLWKRVFDRFFPAVWVCVVLIPLSGVGLLKHLGGALPHSVLAMTVLGAVMILIFVEVALIRFSALKKAVEAKDWPAGAKALGQIRQRVGFNLILGTLTIASALIGRAV
jgi:uncharacterized membrane protein